MCIVTLLCKIQSIFTRGDLDFNLQKSLIKGDQLKMCIVTDFLKLPSLFQNQFFFSHRDLDLGDIEVILSRDTLSKDGEQMCQMILISLQ